MVMEVVALGFAFALDWCAADLSVWAEVEDLLGLSLSPVLITSSLRRFLEGVGDSLRTMEARGVFMMRLPSSTSASSSTSPSLIFFVVVAAGLVVVVVVSEGEVAESAGVCRMTLIPAIEGGGVVALLSLVVVEMGVGVGVVGDAEVADTEEAAPGEDFLCGAPLLVVAESVVALLLLLLVLLLLLLLRPTGGDAAFAGGDKRGGVVVVLVAEFTTGVAAAGVGLIPPSSSPVALLLWWWWLLLVLLMLPLLPAVESATLRRGVTVILAPTDVVSPSASSSDANKRLSLSTLWHSSRAEKTGAGDEPFLLLLEALVVVVVVVAATACITDVVRTVVLLLVLLLVLLVVVVEEFEGRVVAVTEVGVAKRAGLV